MTQDLNKIKKTPTHSFVDIGRKQVENVCEVSAKNIEL